VSVPGFEDPCAPVQAERRGAFWFVRLNRPDKRNALSTSLLESLAAVCATVEADPDARALVLWGAGGNFCAGADFAEFEKLMEIHQEQGTVPISDSSKHSMPTAESEIGTVPRHNRAFGRVLEQLAALPVPTVGVVRGAAMGGGCGLAATLDRVLVAEDATFAMPEVTLGVAPAQIAPFVIRRVGAMRARWIMLAATRLDAHAALAAGLADVVSPLATLESTVRAELQALTVADPQSLRATKRLVTLATSSPLGAALDAAAHEFAALLQAGAAREGIAAARDRRRPAWHVAVPTLPEFA
jgi:isohexenylglutaconyl-CoA hydratase